MYFEIIGGIAAVETIARVFMKSGDYASSTGVVDGVNVRVLRA